MPIFYFLSSSLISLFTSSSFQSSSNFSHLLPLFFFWFFFLVFNSDQEQQQKEITVLQVSSGLKRVKVSSEHDKFHETYVLDRDTIDFLFRITVWWCFSLFSCSSSKLQCLHQALQSNTLQNSC
nr:uncharacterized protein LOC113722453 isoform X2 [Coffea arabica]